ncbi:unnamed protein product [Prorocentrum cordatum]|uniref:Uncharacterized protein n=1 Tax=Prorocentrum cordatum TaxID=2364126 RepID=A0ABN9Q849_9DINO|nr:unnamed protein product [Polarella glacialis]
MLRVWLRGTRCALHPLCLLLRWLWRAWPFVTAIWFGCAIWVTAALKSAKHKGLFSVLGNGMFSSLLLAPFALLELDQRSAADDPVPECSGPVGHKYRLKVASLAFLRQNVGLVLLVATLTGLNRALTNASLYFIDAWLKTALLALTVPLTFVFGAAVPAVDLRARGLFCGPCCASAGQFYPHWRSWSTLAMIPALLLISIGGIVTALPDLSEGRPDVKRTVGAAKPLHFYVIGVAIQMLSNCAGAAQNVFTKVLLTRSGRGRAASVCPGSARETTAASTSDDRMLTPRAPAGAAILLGPGCEDGPVPPPPCKSQIALLTQPILAAFGLLSVLLFEHGDFTPPPLGALLAFALGVTGIVVCELRLIELTSALTIAVLAAAHNVVMVIFFLAVDGEGGDISEMQAAGYSLNTVGVCAYAAVKHWQNSEDEALLASASGEALLTDPSGFCAPAPPLSEAHPGRTSGSLAMSAVMAASRKS